jgi:hypothetical protein
MNDEIQGDKSQQFQPNPRSSGQSETGDDANPLRLPGTQPASLGQVVLEYFFYGAMFGFILCQSPIRYGPYDPNPVPMWLKQVIGALLLGSVVGLIGLGITVWKGLREHKK